MTLAVSGFAAASPPIGSAADVCAFVDELAPIATGKLVFEGPGGVVLGAVFVEDGRVCWAAARGLARRLGDLLAASCHVDISEMESLYAYCQRERVPLGEHLVGRGLVTPAELRGTLLRHTAESLLALCAPGGSAEWYERDGPRYSPRFTFSTPEILCRAIAMRHPDVARAANEELACALSEGDWGAAFVRAPASAAPDPVAVQGEVPCKVEALMRLGCWASSTLDIVGLSHAANALLASVFDDSAIVAWTAGGTIFAGVTGAHGPARLLNRRARSRRMDPSHGPV